MSTLTIELPEILSQQVEQRGLSPQRLQQLFVGWVQSYLQRSDTAVANQTATPSATTFPGPDDQKITNSGIVMDEVALMAEKPYRYPSVPMPVSSLDVWMNLLSEGYEGDALVDTEALYEEV
jgi:hypothetical protein